jgi:HK97 family phage prohead protease
MRSIRGLHVIRSGGALTGLRPVRTEGDDDTAAAPEDGRLATLEVDFSQFDVWYEIDSWWEGQFLERTVSGAFKRTIARNTPKVLFNHGMDLNIGDKVLGVVELLEERPESPHLEAGLLDTSYNRDLLPGLRAGAYGSSFMFEVTAESWEREPEASDYNPKGLPERSITEVSLFEAGPVTWPANPEATAGVRSGTDWMIEAARQRDPEALDDLVRSLAGFRAMNGLRSPLDGEGHATPSAPDLDAAKVPDLDGSLTPSRKQYLQWMARQRVSIDV